MAKLDKKEKKEIAGDVKEALTKAKKDNPNVDVKNYRKKLKKRTIIISIIIIILIMVFGIFWYITHNPKTLFNTGIDTMFSGVESILPKTSYNLAEGTVTISYEDSVNGDSLTYVAEYKTDLNNKKLMLNTTKTDASEVEEEYTLYSIDNNIYLKQDDEYIKLNNSNILFYDDTDTKQVLKSLNSAIKTTLSAQKYTSTRGTTTINEEETDVTITSLEISGNKTIEVIKSITINLLNDSAFVKSYGNLYGYTEEEVTTNIEALRDELISNISSLDTLTVNVYTKGLNTPVKVELVLLDNSQTVAISLTKGDNGYEYTKEDNTETQTISISSEEDIISLSSMAITKSSIITESTAINISIDSNALDEMEDIEIEESTNLSDLTVEKIEEINNLIK